MPVLQGNNSTIKPGTETQSGVVRLATAQETLEGTSTTIASTPAGVSLAIGAVVADAPTSLDTLEELAQALNNDPTFGVTTLARLDALEAGSSVDIQALQTELDATQFGAGLGVNGSYSADLTTTYLDLATSLKNADKILDQVMTTAQSDLTMLSVNVSNLGASVSTLTSNVANVVSDVSTLSATVSAHGDTLSEHTIDIASLESSLASISTNTSANSNAIALLDQALTQEIQDRQSAVSVVSGNLVDEIANREQADSALQTSINTKASSTDLTNLTTRVTTAESEIDTLQADVLGLTAGVDLRALETDLQNEISARVSADQALQASVTDLNAHHLHSNSYYANDNVTDIQTQVDAIGTSQGNVIFVSSGSYGGSTLTINNKVNLGIICPNAGNTICELAGGRGLSIGGTSERVRITNLQIEGATSITGTKGRHIFQSVQFLGGLTIDGVTDTSSTFMTFTDCEFASQNITISNITNCTIYFNRCSFSNVRVLPTNVASPFLIILSECSGLNSLQTNLTSGVAIVGRTGYSSGIVKVFSTSSNYISALGVETAFTGSYSELRDKPSLVTASTQLSDSSSLLRTSDKGVANGVAELDANGLIPNHHIPPLALSKPYVVNTLADRDALTGINTGDVAIVTSDSTPSNNGNYIYDDTIPSWIALYNPTAPVSSVNGQTGTVTLYTGDISEGVGAQGEASKLYFTDSRALSASVTSSINTDDKAPTTQAVKLYVTGLTDALDTRLDSVESSITTFATTTYVDNGLSAKLNSSSYTASDVFNKVLSLDGSGSGLEADLLDGFHASSFVQTTGTQSIAGVKTFSDAPIVPDQSASDNSTKVANTKYVDSAISSIQATIGSSGTLVYQGTYNATANTPSLVSAKKGFFYQVSVSGTLAGINLTTNDQIVFVADVSGGVVQATDFIVIDNTESGVSSGGVAVANIGNGGTMQSGIYYLYDGSTNISVNVPARAVTQGTGAVTWLRIRGTGQVTLTASGVSGGEFIVYADSGTVNGVKSVVLTKAGEYKLVCTRRTISGTVYAQWDVTVSNDRALRTTDDLVEGTTNKYASSTNVRSLISATSPIVYTQATGVISTTLTQYTDEMAQDASATLLTSGTHTGISYSYNDASNKIDSTVSLASFSVNALSDVDTASVAPTNGQALVWESASSQWKPGTVSGGGGGSLPTIVSTTSNAYVPSAPASGTLEVTYLLSPTANGTVTLTNIVPSVSNAGMKLNFKKLTSFLMTINPSAGITIDGLTAGTDIIQQYACLTIQSTGTSWIII
jgi:hypothetical protein